MNHTSVLPKRLGIEKWLLVIVAAVLVTNALALALAYMMYPGYLDNGEPNIVALAWRLLDGHEVYLPMDHETRITNLYGPYLYLIHALVFAITGASVTIGKAPAIAALVAAFALLAAALRRLGPMPMALALAVLGAFFMLNLPMTIWDRSENFMLAAVAAGVAIEAHSSAGSASRRLRIIGYGLLVGLVIGMKLFAAIYFLPFGLMMLWRDGIRTALMTGLIAFVTAASPYFTPFFDIKDMLDLIAIMASKPNGGSELTKVLRYSLYFLVPTVVCVGAGWRFLESEKRREVAVLAGGFVLGVALTVYPAQKPGAGYYYMLPFAPIAGYLMAVCFDAVHRAGKRWAVWGAAVMSIALALPGIPIEKRILVAMDWQLASGVAEEIESIMADYPNDKIEIGVGHRVETYRRTHQRTRLVFAGNPYSFDTPVVLDTTAWGVPLPQASLDLIARCKTDIWLIPAGERPFAWFGYYGKDVYGQAFRDSFNGAYEKTGSRKFFDIYQCRKRS